MIKSILWKECLTCTFLHFLITLLACLTLTARCDNTIVANIDGETIKGKITFKQSAPSSSVNIKVSLNGLNSTARWGITSGFIDNNGDNDCSSSNIGSIYNPHRVPLGVTCDMQNQLTTCPVGNLTSRYGFIPTHGQITFQDTLLNLSGNLSIAGRTMIIQDNSKWLCVRLLGSGVAIVMSSRMHGQIQGRVLFHQVQPITSSSTSITTLYLSLAALHSYENNRVYQWQIRDTCNSSAAYAPNGELTSKHAYLSVDPTLTKNKLLINDRDLPLNGSRSIEGKYVVLFTNDSSKTIKSCGIVKRIHRKILEATVNSQGVTGSIRLEQNSELDPVRLHVMLNNLNGLATTYGIYQYPVGLKLSPTDNPCRRLGQIYNPTNMNINQHSAMNLLPIGDLSGKFGNLTNQLGVNSSFLHYQLQLFGEFSVVGRSIAIRSSSANRDWICSTLNYPSLPLIKAQVRLVFPVVGNIIFTQYRDDPYADTSIYITISQSGRDSPSVNHNWHVHTQGYLTDTMSTSGRCTSAAGHYNPSNVNISASDYKARCKANPILCELGDLSTRQGGISIGDQVNRYYYNDINTPLSGKNSILGRSVVVHAKQYGAGRISCGKIMEIAVGHATADLNQYGKISFQQVDPAAITIVNLNLKNLNSEVSASYIGSTPKCDPIDIFNPFQKVSSAIEGSTNDQYPVGNLTGKLGIKLNHALVLIEKFQDTNLPLFGTESVIGRSVALIGIANDKIKQCATLQRTQIPGSFVTIQHNWHVHESPVNNDATASQGRCASTEGHYNPFMVNVTKPAYTQQCNRGNYLRCEVGDSSGKSEQINITDNFQYLTTDSYLPLSGVYTVLGRSIVIHAANSGGGRIACADIIPQVGNHSALITLPNTASKKYNTLAKRFVEDRSQYLIDSV
ncbi:uncharacterized protein TRIADDRAFT_58654 [Trichoplax adhaerens]|uniref:Superoxide dismutase copper/zinc binding domain-containing protein n=1 Tax=Trichoplax adhaerens TaxID=10228 RepID=B3S3A9_TRIAD|nr:hypothetical protein TRIADDRAFT_58654 [Trichoplax adhaerens]EDV22758.1 hypothetical protein TRIADDRAFT_58654 [Trichoplax adhaerens]|eukprot:XP_002114624.1 hypothetical protein TRIADDRAFT_58654 [Trichoplax adhaerens]